MEEMQLSGLVNEFALSPIDIDKPCGEKAAFLISVALSSGLLDSLRSLGFPGAKKVLEQWQAKTYWSAAP